MFSRESQNYVSDLKVYLQFERKVRARGGS